MKLSIKHKIVLLIAIIFVPLIVFSAYHYFEMLDHAQQHLPDGTGEHVYLMTRNYLIAILSIGIAALGLSLIIGRKISKRLSSVSAGMKEIEQGNLSFRLDIPGNDELTQMADAFNKMALKRKGTEEFLTSVLDGIGEGVIVVDRSYRIISANKHYCQQHQIEMDDIIGKHCYEISHHMNEPCFKTENSCVCTVRMCFETGEHHRSVHTHYDKSGNSMYIETNAYPLKDNEGNFTFAIETLTNITDMVKLERRLDEIKEQYQVLAPDMMHSVDKDGNIIICNTTEAETLGYRTEELIGQNITKIIPAESMGLFNKKLGEIKNNGFYEGELILVTKDEKRIPVLAKSKAIYDNTGNFLISKVRGYT